MHTQNTEVCLFELIDEYSNMLLKLAFTYLKNTYDAEDVVQDVFLKLFEKNPKFDNKEHAKFWLIRVTINKCKNILKSSWFKKTTALDENLSYIPKEEIGIIDEVLKLPPKYKAVIHLYYYEDYSIEQIAKILSRKPSTIGTQLERGRALLKKSIQGGN